MDIDHPLLNGPRRVHGKPTVAPAERPRPSLEEIEASKSAKGGFTRAALEKLGVSWPPPKGWLRELQGRKPRKDSGQKSIPEKPTVLPTASSCFDPRSPDFDSTKHGLLAPPRVTYTTVQP